MKSEKDIKRYFQKATLSTNPNKHDAIFQKIRNAHDQLPIETPVSHWTNLKSSTMKSPITKIAAALAIIILCVTASFFWRSTSSSIALADVLTRIEQITGYMYQVNSTTTKQGFSTSSMSTVLVSQAHGVKTVTKVTDPTTSKIAHQEKYWLPGRNSVTLIRIDHDKKTYLVMTFGGAASENHEEEVNDPRRMIKEFLSCGHARLGKSIIDGITVEGFQTTDPAYKGSFSDQAHLLVAQNRKVNVKIWVDVNTFLPVRSEEEIVTRAGTHNHEVSYGFQWDVAVNASDFEPNIPDDYANLTGDISLPAFTEKAAIKGLKLFADFAKHYPASLSGKNFTEQSRELMGYHASSWKELPNDEKARRNKEILKPIVGLGVFYKGLVEEKKEPAYYGETVSPDDADKVLLRWKEDGGQYRVIFGDLRAETVNAERLAELEKLQSE